MFVLKILKPLHAIRLGRITKFYVGYGAVSEKGLHRVLLYAEILNCCGFWRISSIAACISFCVGSVNSPTAVK